MPRQTSSIPTISAKPAAKGVSTKGFVLPEVQSAVDEATPPMLKALQSGGTCCSWHHLTAPRIPILICASSFASARIFGVIFLLVVGAAEWVTPSLQEKIAKTPGLLQSECSTQSQLDIH